MSEDQIQPPKEEDKTSGDAPKPVDKPPLGPVNVSEVDPKGNSNNSDTEYKKRKRKPLSCFDIWIVVLTIIGIIVAAGTGSAIVWQDIIANSSLAEVRRANNDTERQFEEQQRPWVGLSGKIGFPKQPVFQVFPANIPASTGIDVNTVFKIRNFGISPTFKTVSEVRVWEGDDTLALPLNQMELTCGLADKDAQEGESVLFPSGEITVDHDTITGRDIKLANIRRVWLMGCIAYQDGMSNMIHHTKFWVRSFMIPENQPPKIVERRPIVTFFSVPISGWVVVKTDAD